MAFIKITSENPKFSWVLQKNPATGLQLRNVKNGQAFGWFGPDEQSYHIWFREGDDQISFPLNGNTQFDYNNVTRYNSSLCYLSIIREYLSHLNNNDPEEDVEAKFEIVINMVHVQRERYLKFFKKYYQQFNLEYENLVSNSYRVKISGNETLGNGLRFAQLFLFFNVLNSNAEYRYVNDDDVEKYHKFVEKLNSPYFILYLFKIRLLRNKKLFETYKPRMEKYSSDKLKMYYGDTGDQRREFIQNHINHENPVLDWGAGEMRTYGFNLAKKVENTYIAYDLDAELMEQVKHHAKNRKLTNLEAFSAEDKEWVFSMVKNSEFPFQLICSEVIEHMPVEESSKMLTDLFSLGFEKMVITTPDVRFNEYYELDGMRHEDHHIEMDDAEFEDLVEDALIAAGQENNYTMKWYGIGDVVNGVCNSQAIVLTKKN